MMNEVIPGLWIGDLPSAMNVETLKSNNIFSILSAMRGRITVHETFIRHQILIDDTEDADILTHLLPSIHFIQAELDKGRGVLVHCQAGVSRSATIVAAYLMYSKNLDPEGALALIRDARPYIDPNANFLLQLELFHKANCRVSKKEKDIRRYYLGRTVDEVMNGDGSIPKLDMFASHPLTPSESNPPTPGGPKPPRRRIRCKMCRQELATREHMLDHGQLGPATPAPNTPAAVTPVASRRPSDVHVPRRHSRLSFSAGLGDSLAMSAIEPNVGSEAKIVEEPALSPSGLETNGDVPLARGNAGADKLRNFRTVSRGMMESVLSSSLSMSALDDDEDSESETGAPPTQISVEAARLLGRRLSEALMTVAPEQKGAGADDTEAGTTESSNTITKQEPMTTTHLISPANLVTQLYANPKLAALRSPSFGPSSPTSSANNPLAQTRVPVVSPPIIMNPKCSGYFVEPMKWMEPFLEEGQLAGKILCPNKKCGVKLGNYDWAGVCCGCKEWVVPGFCINRSKVDEIVV